MPRPPIDPERPKWPLVPQDRPERPKTPAGPPQQEHFKRWGPRGISCQICSGNIDDGDIPMRQNFRSGHDAPPAHPNCDCVLILILNPRQRPD